VGTDYSALLNNKPHISAAVVDRDGDTAYHYLDGGTPATEDITDFDSQSNGNNLYIGRGQGGSDNWKGSIAEIILYQGALTSDELNDVGYYLQQKYDVSGQYVPEPSTLLLLLVGSSAALLWRRRRG